MKLDNGQLGGISTPQTGPASPSSYRGGRFHPPAGDATGHDQVQLSGLVGRISQTMRAEAEQRANRVGQLAKAFEGGRYQVDATRLSHRLVDGALALAGSRGPSGQDD